jgi:hypothetical protein
MKKWRKRPRAAVAAPPSKLALPRRPAATDWKMRVGGRSAFIAQKRQA